MFAPPRVLPTTVYAELPASLSLAGEPSEWLFGKDKPDHGAFLEGPVFDPLGNLYVVDIPFGRIFRVAPDGRFATVVRYDGEPNGLARHPDGRLFIADHRRGILALDPDSGRMETVLTRVRREGFKGTNDLIFASGGELYFTDQGETGFHDPTGRVFRYTTKGKLDCLVANVPSPNGLVMDPKETMLYVAVTRANAAWRVPIRPDGSVHRVGLFCQLIGGWGPDGMAVDAQGNVLMAHAGGGAVWVWSAEGLPLYRVVACDGSKLTTNMAYGGKDNRSLFITNSFANNVLVAEMPHPGLPMFASM